MANTGYPQLDGRGWYLLLHHTESGWQRVETLQKAVGIPDYAMLMRQALYRYRWHLVLKATEGDLFCVMGNSLQRFDIAVTTDDPILASDAERANQTVRLCLTNEVKAWIEKMARTLALEPPLDMMRKALIFYEWYVRHYQLGYLFCTSRPKVLDNLTLTVP